MAKMLNAPVYYALIQAQFSPVAAMDKYVGEIQDVLRRDGFTLFEMQETTQLQFLPTAEGLPPEPRIVKATVWLISKADKSCGFILSPSSLTFHTTHYDTHEQFIEDLMKGLSEIHGILKLDHVSRLGLRYLNAVLPREGETVDIYLNEGVRGTKFTQQQYSLHESVYRNLCESVANTTLIARVHRAEAQLGYPPDINPSGLVSRDKFLSTATIDHAVIDIDHFSVDSVPVDTNQIHKKLEELHSVLRAAFDAISTSEAKKIWNS